MWKWKPILNNGVVLVFTKEKQMIPTLKQGLKTRKQVRSGFFDFLKTG
jgi:hypothetical protein